MATAKQSTGFHSYAATGSKTNIALGDYNAVTPVLVSTVIDFTGSRAAGTGFISQVVTTVTCSLAGGSQLLGTGLSRGTYYPIGIKRVETGALGIVHVLHK